MPTAISNTQIERLRDLMPIYRKIKGYSIEKFAGFLGLDRLQLSRLESGKTKFTQIHFRAIYDIISETTSELDDAEDLNVGLILILILSKTETDLLDDEEYLLWKQILIQLSKIDELGNVTDQIKLLKGFAIASMNLEQGERIPEIYVLEQVINSVNELLKSIREITYESYKN